MVVDPDSGMIIEDDAGADSGMDSGVPDAGMDAGTPDSGTPDAGAPDAGMPDAGVPDAGIPDAGMMDAGAPTLCTASNIPGTCMDVSECYGTRSATAGLCPGPANIQCCTPRYANSCNPNTDVQPNVGLTQQSGSGGCSAM